MNSNRLPRFKRAPVLASMQLTERDREIIRQVYRHRFLRSTHIIALIGASSQPILRRLQLLYHHGYLERPRVQIDYYYRGGSHFMAYGLGNAGETLLKQEMGDNFHALSWKEKNSTVGSVFLEHALLVSEIMVAIELGCRKKGIRLVNADAFHLPNAEPVPHPFTWKVKINSTLELGTIPDRVFTLEPNDPTSDGKPILFFLEADRGTMPVIRNNLTQSSFYRKLLAYEATWSSGLHQCQFGFNRMRVLTVTKSPARVASLIDACLQLKSGHGLFLFTDQATLEKHGDIFTLPWKTGRRDETATIFN